MRGKSFSQQVLTINLTAFKNKFQEYDSRNSQQKLYIFQLNVVIYKLYRRSPFLISAINVQINCDNHFPEIINNRELKLDLNCIITWIFKFKEKKYESKIIN